MTSTLPQAALAGARSPASPASAALVAASAHGPTLDDAEFARFCRFIFDNAGITLAQSKKALVAGRLGKRLHQHQLSSYADYLRLLASGQQPGEVQMAIDLLTTNETYFFRENQHFDFLRQQAQAPRPGSHTLRVWSAASSSGEEAYSIAMVLADVLPDRPWEVLGTDISTKVLREATHALYTMNRGRHIPPAYLRRFCLKGTGDHDGHFLIERSLRARVFFAQVNLNTPLPDIGQFDLIFLRNVMIYFSDDTKRQVVARVSSALRPGGHFLVGHSESLHNLQHDLVSVAPSIYRKPG